MADRFSGTIYIGGRISQDTFDKVAKLAYDAGCVDQDFEADGGNYFDECNESDLKDLVDYCKDNKIALMIQWDAKYEYDGMVQYFVDEKYKEYTATNDGEIVVRLSDLEEHPCMFIRDFINKMEVPSFPNLEIEE